MNDIFQAATTFPTVALTVLLVLVVLYWLSVILGAVDIDMFAADGIGEALDGVDGVIDGAAEGAAEALDGGEVGGEGSSATSALSALGLRKVPITVVLSLIILFSWFISMVGTHMAPQLVGATLSKWAIGPVVLILALFVALIITSFVVRPLAPLFETKEAKRRADYIGSTCTITTGRVDGKFGQGNITEGADVLVVNIRCDLEDSGLKRGDRALIIDFDNSRLAYVIEPMEQLLAADGDTVERS